MILWWVASTQKCFYFSLNRKKVAKKKVAEWSSILEINTLSKKFTENPIYNFLNSGSPFIYIYCASKTQTEILSCFAKPRTGVYSPVYKVIFYYIKYKTAGIDNRILFVQTEHKIN